MRLRWCGIFIGDGVSANVCKLDTATAVDGLIDWGEIFVINIAVSQRALNVSKCLSTRLGNIKVHENSRHHAPQGVERKCTGVKSVQHRRKYEVRDESGEEERGGDERRRGGFHPHGKEFAHEDPKHAR